jgi:hypothetical protein
MRVLKACVPAVPGIAFLSGGQGDEEATAYLKAINRIGGAPRSTPGLAGDGRAADGNPGIGPLAIDACLGSEPDVRHDGEALASVGLAATITVHPARSGEPSLKVVTTR